MKKELFGFTDITFPNEWSFWFRSSTNILMLYLRDAKALHKTNLRCPRTTLLFQIWFLFSIPKTTHEASEGTNYLMFMHVTLEKWGFQMSLINELAEENISPKLLTEEPVLPAPHLTSNLQKPPSCINLQWSTWHDFIGISFLCIWPIKMII